MRIAYCSTDLMARERIVGGPPATIIIIGKSLDTVGRLLLQGYSRQPKWKRGL